MSRPHVVISRADVRRLSAPLLEIAPGDVVTPVRAWRQASVAGRGGAELQAGARYTVAKVKGGFSGAWVSLAERPGETLPAHLFAKAD